MPSRWVQTGVVALSVERWRFSRHGVGYRFTEVDGHRVVDAHAFIAQRPSPVDAYRLEQYLSSLGHVAIESQLGATVVEIHALGRALKALHARHVLVKDPRTAHDPFPSYYLAAGQEVSSDA